MRHDSVAGTDVTSRMFILNEAFAHCHGLHERRPKTHVLATAAAAMDMRRLAQITTDRVGERISHATVEAALRDLVDHLGAACADEEAGVVLVDFGPIGRLMCENKSITFDFSAGDGKRRPGTASSVCSSAPESGRSKPMVRADDTAFEDLVAAATSLGLTGADVPGLLPRRAKEGQPPKPSFASLRAPLQRPRRPARRKPQLPTLKQLVESHDAMLASSKATRETEQIEEAQAHADMLQGLRAELVQDLRLHEHRRDSERGVARELRDQHELKMKRDAASRVVVGVDGWNPFRTNEEARAAARATAERQRDALDRQLAQTDEKAALLARVAALSGRDEKKEAERAAAALAAEIAGAARAKATTQRAVEAAVDSAYRRYEEYLERRKAAAAQSHALALEQRELSEREERLKHADQRRRMAEMRCYVDAQRQERPRERERERTADHEWAAAAEAAEPSVATTRRLREERASATAKIMREALTEQMERKAEKARQEREAELGEERRWVAQALEEEQKSRLEALAAQRDRAETLNREWDRQQRVREKEIEAQAV